MAIKNLTYKPDEINDIYKTISKEIDNLKGLLFINGMFINIDNETVIKSLKKTECHFFIKFGLGSIHFIGTSYPSNKFVYFYIHEEYCIVHFTNITTDLQLYNIIENEYFRDYLKFNSTIKIEKN